MARRCFHTKTKAGVCSAGFTLHSAPLTASRFDRGAELWLIKAGLRGVPRSFNKTTFSVLPRGGWKRTHFFALSDAMIRAALFGASHRGEVWGAMRHLGPRSPTWRRSCVRLKPSAKVSGDVTNTNCETRVPTLARRRSFSFSRALSAHTTTFVGKIARGVLSPTLRVHRTHFWASVSTYGSSFSVVKFVRVSGSSVT